MAKQAFFKLDMQKLQGKTGKEENQNILLPT